VSLTVNNYKAWCSVTVGSNGASVADAQTVCVPSGTVNLTATALTGFELGKAPWHDVTTSSGGSATLKVSGSSACAWVCCPFTGGAGCPTTDQCK